MQRQTRTLIPTEVLTAVALVLAGMYGLSQGFHFWATGDIYGHRELLALTIGSYLAGFVCLLLPLVWKPTPRQAGWVVAALVGMTAMGRGYQHLRYVNPKYGTDAVAFNHYAAELVLQGKNPYGASMAPASRRFGVPRKYYTPDEQGRVVSELSYPSLSFLIYSPFVAAHIKNVNWVNLAFLLGAILLAMLLAPAWAAPWMPLVFIIEPEFVNFSVGGVTDILFVPLLLGAVWAWDEHKDLAALLWGLACGIKQGPWFLAPFAAVAMAWEAPAGQKWRDLARFAGIAAAAFVIPNLPFIFSDPKAWFFGVFTPMGRKLVIYGSGLVTLTTTAGLRIPRAAYSLVSLTFLTVLLALFAQFYERLKPMLWIVPAMVLWLAPRSFHSYYIYWVPIFALALARHLTAHREITAGPGAETETDAPAGKPSPQMAANSENSQEQRQSRQASLHHRAAAFLRRPRIPSQWVPALLALPFLLLGAMAAWSSSRPVALTLDDIEATDPRGLGRLTRLDVTVTNHADSPVAPRFALAWNHNNFFFWFPDEPVTIPPKGSRHMVLHPKDPTQAPSLNDSFVIRIYDPRDPVFHLSRLVRPPKRSVGLFNGTFAAWNDQANQPLSWTRWPTFVAAPGTVTMGRVQGKKALCLRAVQTGRNRDWARTILEQKIPASVHRLGFESLVFQRPEGAMSPRILAGLELQFPSGEIALVVPQPGLPHPVAYRLQGTRRPLTLLHLPAPADVSKWSVHWVDLWSLARHFGYDRAVPLSVRLLASRHRSRPGTTKVCFAWVGGDGDPWVVPGRAVAIQQLPDMNNPALRFGTQGHPFGWMVEKPQGCSWSMEPLAATGHDMPDMALSLHVSAGKSEWCRLALSQVPIRIPGPISFQVCSNQATQRPGKPTIIAGLEISPPGRGPVHVWTLCTTATPAPKRLGRIRLHCVAQDSHGCGRISLAPSQFLGSVRPKISLVANLHRGASKALTIEFSAISLSSAHPVP